MSFININLPNELLSRIFVLCSGPIRVFYPRLEVPHQITISQVCSKWRQVALGTGELWSNIELTQSDTKYARRLCLYQTIVGRAGDYSLTVLLFAHGPDIDNKVFLDFLIPFRIKKLDITMLGTSKLADLPSLNAEEFAISHLTDEDLNAPPFMDNTRHLCAASEAREPKLKLSWHQLRSFECYSPTVSLSTWLNVLRQPGALQHLEQCHLTISNTGSGPLVQVCMPNLRVLGLQLVNVRPDIVIPLIAAPNITTLKIWSPCTDWSSDTYAILKKHHNLHINCRNFS